MIFLELFFQRMCVLCIFYFDWELEGLEKLKLAILLSKKLLGVWVQETFFRPYYFLNDDAEQSACSVLDLSTIEAVPRIIG